MTDTVHGLFIRQAATTPDRMALIDHDTEVTYRLLDDLASAIAHLLLKHGIDREAVVGIVGTRSYRTVAALLGILKAGGAYTMISLNDPDERLRSIVLTAGIRLMLSEERFRSGPFEGVDRLLIGDVEPTSKAVATVAGENDLAVVVSTSGSAGRPKCVALTHRNIVARLTGPTAHVPAEPRLQKSSFALIGHVTDLLSPLIHGQPPIIVDDDTSHDPSALTELILRHDVHRLFLVPSMLGIFLESPVTERLRNQLRTLLVSGERLSLPLVGRVRRRFPNASLVQAYGLSETAGTVCYTTIEEDAVITVGRPQDGTVEILNDDLERVEPGGVGQIAVAGPCLAREYLKDPDLTARHFRKNPFGPGRLFLTGDIGRRLVDGRIVLLGRKDREVKIHGLRVNPAEVERVIERHTAVLKAAVVCHEDARGENALSAYIVRRDSAVPLASAELRRQVRSALPDFMVPTRFFMTDQFPLLQTGKVDYRRLLEHDRTELDSHRSVETAGRQLPADNTLSALAEIWRLELGYVEGLTTDDFFELGGDSLTAIRIGMHIERIWRIRVSLRVVLQHARIQELAQWIDSNRNHLPLTRSSGSSLAPSALSATSALSLQQRANLRHELTRRSNAQPQVRMGLRLSGELDCVLLERGINAVIARHHILRTTYLPVLAAHPMRIEGWNQVRMASLPGQADLKSIQWRHTLHDDSVTKIPVIDRRGLSGRALALAIREAIDDCIAQPFDYGKHPLIRVWLIRLSDKEHRLLTVMPHIVADRWSLGIFLKELFCYYDGNSLPRVEVQYADFAQHQQLRLTEAFRERKRQKDHEIPVAALKTIDLRNSLSSRRSTIGLTHERSQYESMRMKHGEYDVLRANSGRFRVTPSMFVFSGIAIYLRTLSGKSQFRITTTQANRTEPDFEHVFGFMASGQQLSVVLRDDAMLVELLEQVRSEFSEAALRCEMVETPVDTHRGIVYEFNQIDLPDVSSLRIERFRLRDTQRAEFGLKFRIEEWTDGLELGLEYCLDCFGPSGLSSVLKDLYGLLAAMIADPTRPVLEYRLNRANSA